MHGVFIYTTAQVEVIEVMLGKIKIDDDVLNNPRKQRIVNAQFVKCTEEIQHLIKWFYKKKFCEIQVKLFSIVV